MVEALVDCGYRNERSHLVILCCSGPGNFMLERVVFPFELLTFRAPKQTQVLIYGPASGDPELLDRCAVESLSLGLETDTDHPLVPASMVALLHDLRHRYRREPSEENRHRLTQLEQQLRQGLPGYS